MRCDALRCDETRPDIIYIYMYKYHASSHHATRNDITGQRYLPTYLPTHLAKPPLTCVHHTHPSIQTKNRLIRCEAASANAQETLPLFSCAVLAASVGGVPAPTVNAVAAAYLATRVVYNVIYVWLQGANSRKVAYARSLSWFAGVACWMTLFVKAGFAFSEGGAE